MDTKSHKTTKIPKSEFPKMAKKSSEIKKSYKILKNPKIEFSFRCVKLRENPENQSFTFFAVLPPYLAVSDSLAYFKRRGLKRSIVWYKKFLISCLVARYSAVFVLKSMEIHENLWKSMGIHGKVQDRHCKIQFATEWASRELLGRPVARYSDVFVFQDVKLESLWGKF